VVDLRNERKLVLLTGGAIGIGAATSELFAEKGYNVAILDLKEATETRERVQSKGTQCLALRCDVSDEEQVRKSVQIILETYGRIDSLLNIAGVALVKPLESTSWEEYRKVVDVNLGGTFLLCKHVTPVMKQQMRGSIVNVASISGHIGGFYRSIYGASKAAVISFTRALAWELAPFKIRVNSVSPGLVDTDLLRKNMENESQYLGQSYQEIRTKRQGDQAFKRFADSREVSEAAYFLASDASSFITAVDLPVDCGWIAK
jgi:NAD(P)-dependent dehydrogenase (short-subunit alcohol dehydrogenase family)